MNEGENILNKVLDFLMKIVFLVCACISIAAVITICVFMFANGVPAIKEIGITKFLFGTQWRVSQNLLGIWPMIVGSIYVTAGAMIIGVPIGILTAVFLAKYCPKKLYKPYGRDSFYYIRILRTGCYYSNYSGNVWNSR